MNNALSITLSCVAIAVLTSGCIKPVAKPSVTPVASLGTSVSTDAGYAERSSSDRLSQAATLATRTPGRVPAAPEPRSERVRYLGSAPHICSPSGFGRKSTCFSRS